jgi:hypothetical protein
MLPRAARLFALLALPAAAACGGKVFVDAPTGGSSGSGGGSGGSGGAGSCAALLQDLDAKILAARACDPTLDVTQCDGSATVVDACGCTIVLDEQRPAEVTAAAKAANAAHAAGCAEACKTCPPVSEVFCVPNSASGPGLCASVPGD